MLAKFAFACSPFPNLAISGDSLLGFAAMVQPQGLSLLKFVLKAMRLQTSDVSSVALWGTTAVCGSLWLVQPFDWISGPKEEDK